MINVKIKSTYLCLKDDVNKFHHFIIGLGLKIYLNRDEVFIQEQDVVFAKQAQLELLKSLSHQMLINEEDLFTII